jgi:DNA-binding MarR family transcriptional regulator
VSAASQRLWSALVAVYQPVLRDVVRALETDAGIDSGEYSALAYLDRAGGRMPLRDLQELMRARYSQPGLSRLVQRLEREGLVERAVDDADRRATTLALTRAGRRRYQRAHTTYVAALDEHRGRHVTAGRAAELAAELEALAAAVATGPPARRG